MDIKDMIEKLKQHPQAHGIGMIANHLGIVRGTSRKGGPVESIEVVYDQDTLNKIINESKSMEGVIEVLVEFNEGRLKVGDEILAVAVAGDIRENVFPALIETVNRIKKEAVKKKEY